MGKYPSENIIETDCKKGFAKVTMKKCKNCPKYQARKETRRAEPLKIRKQKDRDRHEDITAKPEERTDLI